MEIIIDYEASWRNSFLDGSNNEPEPKNGRAFTASMRNLNDTKTNHYQKRNITIDTVMGILCRLIGDPRKLYQSRQAQYGHPYYFDGMEQKVSFEDRQGVVSSEIVFLRNMNNNDDREAFTGAIKTNDPVFKSDYSEELWSILFLTFDELCDYICNKTRYLKNPSLHPLSIVARINDISSLKAVQNQDVVKIACDVLLSAYPSEPYIMLDSKQNETVLPRFLYLSALYLKLSELEDRGLDMSSAKTKQGVICGISKRSFTKKDFMKRFSTGGLKKIYGNPYFSKRGIKGEREDNAKLVKSSGQLAIAIDIEHEKAKELKDIIDCAGVSVFSVGKKGLAYVSSIRI